MKLKHLKPEDYRVFVDLDGVLADLKSYVENVLGESITVPGDGKDWVNSEAIWKRLIAMNEPDFSKLDLLPDAMTLWNYVKKHKPSILTASGKPPEKNAPEKRDWVRNNLTGYDKIHTVVASAQKAKFAWPDSILIDDRMKSLGPWRQKGGIGILHTSAADTIRQLKELGL